MGASIPTKELIEECSDRTLKWIMGASQSVQQKLYVGSKDVSRLCPLCFVLFNTAALPVRLVLVVWNWFVMCNNIPLFGGP